MEDCNVRKIAAGIVTFNPDIQKLEECIHLLLKNNKLGYIYLVDNHSDNITDIRAIEVREQRVKLNETTWNKGIAKGLQIACRKAQIDGYDWILTLDQDSLPEPHFLDHLAARIPSVCCEENSICRTNYVGIICPRIEDVNMGRMYSPRTQGFEMVDHCITAGSLMSLPCWQTVGGFDEGLFIDGVDFEYCLRLRKHGYKILRFYDVCLKQEIGTNSRVVHLAGHRLAIMNHAPERMYYLTRNYLIIGQRYHDRFYWMLEMFKRLAIIWLYEHKKMKKTFYSLCGLIDYFRGKNGALIVKKQQKKGK